MRARWFSTCTLRIDLSYAAIGREGVDVSDRQPKISVGMPVYNGQQFLALAIESVLAQTCGDFELIISDNASTDGTETICRQYAARDRRIVYIRNEANIGAAGNYNQLFHRARAEYFRWFNSDDLSSPLLHEKCLAALVAHPDASMAYGKTEIIDAEGRVTARYEDRLNLMQESAAERFLEYLRIAGMTNAIYGLMRRDAVAKTALMGNGAYPAADMNLMAELALLGKIVEVPQPLFFRRMHEQASSWDRKAERVQLHFWLGRNARFVLPTLKSELALWRAIGRASASRSDKRRMWRHMLRRLFWARGAISRELVHATTSRLLPTR